MANLNTTCYTIEDSKIVEGEAGRLRLVHQKAPRAPLVWVTNTTPPPCSAISSATPIRWTKTDTQSQKPSRKTCGVLAKWATWGGFQVVVREFETEDEAKETLPKKPTFTTS